MQSIPTLIDGCRQGEERSQKALYERFYGYCLKVVFRYIYRYETAVDVVNDGFVKVFRNFSKFSCSDQENAEPILMGWMRTIMVNTAIDHLRKNHFIPEIGCINESAWAIEDKSQPSDKTLLYKELIWQVKKLPPSYRAVFNMYVIDGFTHNEIAAQLGISVGTSKSNLSKARAILQKSIKFSEREVNYAVSK